MNLKKRQSVIKQRQPKLSAILMFWGVERPRIKNDRGVTRDLGLRHLSQWQLKDLLDTCQERWRRLMVEHHPDKGGSTSVCAELNSTWDRTKVLFKQRGIAP